MMIWESKAETPVEIYSTRLKKGFSWIPTQVTKNHKVWLMPYKRVEMYLPDYQGSRDWFLYDSEGDMILKDGKWVHAVKNRPPRPVGSNGVVHVPKSTEKVIVKNATVTQETQEKSVEDDVEAFAAIARGIRTGDTRDPRHFDYSNAVSGVFVMATGNAGPGPTFISG